MSLQDPIADMLIRLKNAQSRGFSEAIIPASTQKIAICDVLAEEGYINGYEVLEENGKRNIKVILKYFKGKPVIESLIRISKPSLRIYKKSHDLPVYKGGLGIALISTSKGIMSNLKARTLGLGGEVICFVS